MPIFKRQNLEKMNLLHAIRSLAFDLLMGAVAEAYKESYLAGGAPANWTFVGWSTCLGELRFTFIMIVL